MFEWKNDYICKKFNQCCIVSKQISFEGTYGHHEYIRIHEYNISNMCCAILFKLYEKVVWIIKKAQSLN